MSVGALGARRESLALDPLWLELRVTVHHLVQVGDQTQVLGTSRTLTTEVPLQPSHPVSWGEFPLAALSLEWGPSLRPSKNAH